MLRPQPFSLATGQAAQNFKQPVRPLSDTRRHIFGGFRKRCYWLQKFDSDPERRFAVIIDDDLDVDRWMKPGSSR
jgi:type III restriction enzyme